MKKAKQLLVIIPALLLGTAAATGCKGNALGRKLDMSNEADKSKLYEVVDKYESLETTKVLSSLDLSLNVNKLSAIGDTSIYQSDFDITNPTKKTTYKKRTLKNTGFSIDNQKTGGTTIPNWALKQLLSMEFGSSSKTEEAKDDPVDPDDPGEIVVPVEPETDYSYSWSTDYGPYGQDVAYISGLESLSTDNFASFEVPAVQNIDGTNYFVTKFDAGAIISSILDDHVGYPISDPDSFSINFNWEDKDVDCSGLSLSLANDGVNNLYAALPKLSSVNFYNGSHDGIDIGNYIFKNETGEVKNLIIGMPTRLDDTSYVPITSIGDYAFSNLTLSFAYVYDNNIPLGLNGYGDPCTAEIYNIGERAFENSSFTSPMDYVSFVGDIGDYAFYNTQFSGSDTINVCSATKIGYNAFSSIEGIYGINFGDGSLTWKLLDEQGETGNEWTPSGDPQHDYSVYEDGSIEGLNVNPCDYILEPKLELKSKSNNLNLKNNYKNLFANVRNDEEEDEELPGLNLAYILAFPLVKDVVDYFIAPETYGLTPWENMTTDFYLETSSNGNEHINFIIKSENLTKLVSEFEEKYQSSVRLPFSGEGTFSCTLKTDDYGYISYLNLKVDGTNTSFAIGKASAINDTNSSNVSNSDGNGINMGSIMDTLLTQLLSGGLKFTGELHCDVALSANRTLASSKNAVFYQQTIDDQGNKVITDFGETSNYRLVSQKLAYNPLTETNVVAEDPTAIYDNNNYAVRILPKKYDDGTEEGAYYKIDLDNTYISVNGVRQTLADLADIKTDYASNYCGYTLKHNYYMDSMHANEDCLSLYLGRGLINSIRSMLGDDAVFQIVVGITK